MKTSQTAGCTLMAIAVAALPFSARASKDIMGGEAVVAILVVLALFLALVISNFILSLLNINRKRLGVRIYNCMATGLLFLLILPIFEWSVPTALVLLCGILIQAWLIYLGFPSKNSRHEQYDI